MKLTAIDVCAGAGGFSLGLHRAGFDVLGVEKEPDAIATHRIRIAREANARMVIMENSDGLRSSEGALDAVIRECRRQGFDDVRFQTLCAADYGTPQKRYRLFIVGTRLGATWRWPDPTHGEGPMVPLFGLKPWVTVRQALGLPKGPRRSGRIDGAVGWNGQRMLDVDGCAPVTSRTNPELLDEPACVITANAGHPGSDPERPSKRPLGCLTEALGDVLDAPANTVSAGGTGGGGGAEPFANADYRRKLERALDQPALTLGAGHDTYPDGDASAVLHRAVIEAGLSDRPSTTVCCRGEIWPAGHHANGKDRLPGGEQPSRNQGTVRLSVDQCALLQGFPSGWEWTGNKASQHKQVGNAVPPQLSEALGRSARGGLQCS